jgi:hypothetical protein
MEWLPFANCKFHGSMVSRNRLAGGDCKPVYAADFGNDLVVNDTFKRQIYLSGADTGDAMY